MLNDEERKADQAFYHSPAWRQLRNYHLRSFPLCADCGRPGNECHHLQNRKEFPTLALSSDNLLTLCTPCHSKRTAKDIHDRYKHHIVLLGFPQQRAKWLDANRQNGDLVIELDTLADAIGFASIKFLPTDITNLLISWRIELLRLIKTDQIKRRCVICVEDWSTGNTIAADLGTEVTQLT